ncbi:MAG: hypothetical protein P8X73_02615 [Ignavibacteriaceae bacterium]
MGQQQLLLIVLALIIVGVAIVIAIQLFSSNAIESKRDILIKETTAIATLALQYYKKPAEMGGGGKSFLGWTIPPPMVTTYNGNFMTASVTNNQVIITGTGTEIVTGTDSIQVDTYVTSDDIYTVVIH